VSSRDSARSSHLRHLTPEKVAVFADAASTVVLESDLDAEQRDAMDDILAFLRAEAKRDELRPVVVLAVLALDSRVKQVLAETGGVPPTSDPRGACTAPGGEASAAVAC